jgi:hypothetical protein
MAAGVTAFGFVLSLLLPERPLRDTAAGRAESELVVSARRELLTEALADETADRRPEVAALLARLARELCGEPPSSSPDPGSRVVA